jgi:signal transduction histidine kinase
MNLLIRVAKDWTGTTRVVLLMAASVALLWLLQAESKTVAEAVAASGLVSYALVLGASVLIYFHWRMVDGPLPNRLAGWLTIALLVGALHGFTQSAPLDTTTRTGPNSWPLVSQLVLLLVLAVIATIAEEADVHGDPAVVGAIGGVLLGGVFLGVTILGAPLVVAPALAILLNTLVMLGGLAVAWIVLHRTKVSPWIRRRLAFAVILLTGAQCVANLHGGHLVLGAIAVCANIAGAVALCTMALDLLRKAIADHQRQLRTVHATLEEVRAGVLGDRELLHEVGSMIAGIASASSVMRHGRGLSHERRKRLEEMLEAELARLQRLMSHSAPSSVREVDVDRIIEPLVVSHQTRGLDVRWQPSGLVAVGDPDDLAEVVNILLENATRHGRGEAVELTVRAKDGGVEISCTDRGPGVAPEVRDQIFTSGVRGPFSRGQGLGLPIARRLMTEHGGSLELVDSTAPGARFVARLAPAGAI